MEEKILMHVKSLFMQYGTRSVSMDDIARGIGISKKTIYQYFEDKNAMVQKLHNYMIDFDKKMIENIHQISKDAVEEVLKITQLKIQEIRQINPCFIHDLRKYHPEVWELHHAHHQQFVKNAILQNLNRGVSEGLYHTEFNMEIIATLRIASFEGVAVLLEPLQMFDMKEVISTMTAHFLRGLITEKGLEKYNIYRNELIKQAINPQIIP